MLSDTERRVIKKILKENKRNSKSFLKSDEPYLRSLAASGYIHATCCSTLATPVGYEDYHIEVLKSFELEVLLW